MGNETKSTVWKSIFTISAIAGGLYIAYIFGKGQMQMDTVRKMRTPEANSQTTNTTQNSITQNRQNLSENQGKTDDRKNTSNDSVTFQQFIVDTCSQMFKLDRLRNQIANELEQQKISQAECANRFERELLAPYRELKQKGDRLTIDQNNTYYHPIQRIRKALPLCIENLELMISFLRTGDEALLDRLEKNEKEMQKLEKWNL